MAHNKIPKDVGFPCWFPFYLSLHSLSPLPSPVVYNSLGTLSCHGDIICFFCFSLLGQTIDFQGPCGGFEYQARQLDHLTLLASGGGITPGMQLIREVMADPRDTTNITLLYFSENYNEILFREELDSYKGG